MKFMQAVLVNRKFFRFIQSLQNAPWVQMLSVVLLICFIAVSIVNLSLFDEHAEREVRVQFSSMDNDQTPDSIFTVLEQMKGEPRAEILRTHLDETPFWIYASLNAAVLNHHNQMYFESRHLVQSICWRESTVGELEQLVLRTNQGRLLSTSLLGKADTQGVLCQFSFVGPATLQIGLQSQADFNASSLDFERRQGFLEGVLYLMIGFVALAAIMTRSSLFVSYGFWLFASLRLVALSEGWDHTLFGIELGIETLSHARMTALAMYFASTVLMMWHLFENVRRESWVGVLRALQGASILFMLLALVAPYRTFLELFWPMSLVAVSVVAWVVIQYFLEKRDRVAIYYLAAMLITLTGAVAEVLAAWFEHTLLLQYFNSASVTVFASVMTAVALAEYFRKAQLQQQLAAREIEQAHERLESVFDIAPSAMFTSSVSGELLKYNKRFVDVFLNREGKPVFDFLQAQRLQTLFNLLETPGKSSRRELPIVMGDGQTRWFELVVNRDDRELVGVVSDFTARKDKELALQHQATHDELTGALNRRGLQHSIHNRLIKGAGTFTVFCTEIQQFSRIVSAYGLAVSDQLLQAFQIELHKYLGSYGEVARLHVDQFVVLIHQADALRAEDEFNAFLEKIEATPFQLDGRAIQPTVLATLVFQGVIDNVLDVMETVEVSMRESSAKTKRSGQAERIVYEQNQTRRLLEQSRTIRRLGDQKLPQGLTLAWQPILALEQPDMPLYAEALLRIKGEDGQLSSAGFLLEACERGGHTAFLDNWVLSQSLDFLSENSEALKKLSVLSINVSPGSLNDEVFLQDTLALILVHQAQASKLCLEITEVGSVINLPAVQTFIEQVRTLGVRIALDDFGAGYSNFRYAIDLHADVIKIDGSIIKNICHSTESHAVTTAIVGLAHDLGCKCVAEWVEDLHTLREVKELGVDYVQGYLISPAVECTRFLNLQSPLDLMQDQDRAMMIQDIVDALPC
ncbi:EAL domain-containing protein [Limnobacter parvus]|uniref:EAL domain-containing protein n=1 Tax=Limnobacter parvus TaxID=2939690 RepID=A0ABT1XK38_9BURK|nr:EAL domain-containing protein [Limnobacter parvus]MCR2747660.1 EAL domain-containing protein [Limnobacter parvus]